MVVSGNAHQFGEGLPILSITITSTTASQVIACKTERGGVT
jgi:hypothetical protein